MPSIKPLSSFNFRDLKKLIPNLYLLEYQSEELSKNSHHLIFLLSKLNVKHTLDFIKSIDSFYPGMSFHYIMEARQLNKEKEYQLFLFRISYYIFSYPDNDLFSQERKKLIHALLFDEKFNKTLFSELHTSLQQIENLTALSQSQKSFIKKNINDKFFEQFQIHF